MTAQLTSAHDARRRSFVGLTLARMGFRPFTLVSETYVALLLATRVHSAFAITFALTVHRYVTAVIFPVVGRLSDRTTGRFGRRVPYMAIGLVVMAGAVWSLSVLPGYWLLVAAIVLARVAAVFHSTGQFTATPDIFGRSRWVRAALTVFVAGILPGLLTAGVIRATWHQNDPSTWAVTFRLAATGLLFAAVAVAVLVREVPASRTAAAIAARRSWREELADLADRPNAKVIVLGTALVLASIAAFTRLLPVWAEQVLHAGGNHQASASVLIVLGSVLMIPPGLWVSGRARPRTLTVAACVVGAALAAAHVLITQLALFVVLAVAAIPLTVAAVASLVPVLVGLVPRSDNTGEGFGLVAGPVAVVSLIASYLSAVLVDATGSYRVIWIVSAVFLAAAALVYRRLDLPDERTDLRAYLRGRSSRSSLFGGQVEDQDVLAGEVLRGGVPKAEGTFELVEPEA